MTVTEELLRAYLGAEAPDRFRVFLAVDNGLVVGYLDVTNCFEENEPFALKVKETYRRRGWGEKASGLDRRMQPSQLEYP